MLIRFVVMCVSVFCFKQKTAYEMRISDWSSDVCSSDLPDRNIPRAIIGSSLLIIALYLLVNLGYFLALSPLDIANLPESASVAGVVMTTLLDRTSVV